MYLVWILLGFYILASILFAGSQVGYKYKKPPTWWGWLLIAPTLCIGFIVGHIGSAMELVESRHPILFLIIFLIILATMAAVGIILDTK